MRLLIKGIGNDLVENQRFVVKLKEDKSSFFQRIFTKHEIEYCQKYKSIESQAEHYAARFAAKEALVKAIGTGFRKMSFHEIEVKNDELGAPYFEFSGRVEEILFEMEVENVHLTLTHTTQHALATVVIEGRRKD